MTVVGRKLTIGANFTIGSTTDLKLNSHTIVSTCRCMNYISVVVRELTSGDNFAPIGSAIYVNNVMTILHRVCTSSYVCYSLVVVIEFTNGVTVLQLAVKLIYN